MNRAHPTRSRPVLRRFPCPRPVWLSRPALTLLLLALSCGGRDSRPVAPAVPPIDPFVERQIPSRQKADVAKIVEANNRFAFDIYGAVRERRGNLFLSPYSISTAFAMVHAGARGSTAEEIGRVFHFDARQDSLHPAFGALQRSLDRGVSLGGYRISIANRLWGQRGEAFQPEFLDLTRKHYDAEMEIVDFRSNPDAVRVHINDWVANQTEGRIEDLFPEGSISDRSRLVLANAIYFKGSWQYRFNPDDTRDSNFALPQNRRDTVPMMRMLATLPFAQPPGLSVLALPYAGKDLEMVLLLPNEADGLGSLERSFSSDAVVAWTQGTREVEVQVAVPRFGFTSAITLGEVLGRMGMPTAFGDAADFTGIRASGGLKISEAFHQAFILVNEEGTEAAAATGVDMGETSLPVFPEFIADHPFLFLIRDRVTGSILFLGRVENPRG